MSASVICNYLHTAPVKNKFTTKLPIELYAKNNSNKVYTNIKKEIKSVNKCDFTVSVECKIHCK